MSNSVQPVQNESTPQTRKGRWGKFGLGIGILSLVVLLCAIISFFSSFQFMEGMFVPILFITLPLAIIAGALLIVSFILCVIGVFTKDGSRKTALIGLGVLCLAPIFLFVAYWRFAG